MLSVKCKNRIDTVSLLNLAEIQIPRIEAEFFFSNLLKCSRTDLYLYRQELSSLIIQHFNNFLKRRLEGEPLQYILGSVEFYGLGFKLKRGVFIPRPETELLVEEALKWLEAGGWRLEAVKVLDIGTGCGNIAISLAKMLPNAEILAIDVSEEAVRIAEENARLNGVSERIEFLIGDIYKPIKAEEFKFDFIISNPPYIASSEIELLQKEVLWEPTLALDGGLDGFTSIREIIHGASKFLKNRGCIFLEISYNQAEKVKDILKENCFEKIYFVRDYAGVERIVVGELRFNLGRAKVEP